MARSHHSRGRALRTGVAWDMRTGFKTKGRRLHPDGERPGVLTERGWADQRHPQRFVRVPPPDGLNYRPGPPAPHKDVGVLDLGWWTQSRPEGTDTTTQWAFEALRRMRLPTLAINVGDHSFIKAFVGVPPT